MRLLCGKSLQEIQEITFEIGMLGKYGLDINDPQEIRAERYFHKQNIKKQQLPPFFKGEIKYHGEFSRDVMALLELGRLIHVGKMATFGNGLYEIEV